MKIYFMKQSAIDYIKANINTLYTNYYKYETNEWIYDLFDYNPFEFFIETADFELAPIGEKQGITELENCKIIYSNLKEISASQASDERLWAGLCNSVFYSYVRNRWGYPKLKYKNLNNDCSTVLSRFFYKATGRSGMFRNTLAKCWWVGYLTYDEGSDNHWSKLDAIGPEDFSTKINEVFYSNTFSSNEELLDGICIALQSYRERGIDISLRDMFRPTLQYLNAIGGAALLDIFTKDEIANIIIENIEYIRSNKESKFADSNENEDEELETEEFFDEEMNVDYSEEAERATDRTDTLNKDNIFIDKTVVGYGCKVVTRKSSDGKEGIFNIPLNGARVLYPLEIKLLGKAVGESVFMGMIEYTVESIDYE